MLHPREVTPLMTGPCVCKGPLVKDPRAGCLFAHFVGNVAMINSIVPKPFVGHVRKMDTPWNFVLKGASFVVIWAMLINIVHRQRAHVVIKQATLGSVVR